jgi:hypothetical protein
MKNVWYCSTDFMYTERIFFPTFYSSWTSAPMPMPPVSAFWHSGVHSFSRLPDWVHLFQYRTGSSISFFLPVPVDRMRYPLASNFCSSFPAFLLSHWSIFQCTLCIVCNVHSMAGFGQFSGSQAAFGTNF